MNPILGLARKNNWMAPTSGSCTQGLSRRIMRSKKMWSTGKKDLEGVKENEEHDK